MKRQLSWDTEPYSKDRASELGTSGNSRQVYKRLLHATLWFYTWPRRLRRTHIRHHKRSYQARTKIWEGPPRPYVCVIEPEIPQFGSHRRISNRNDRLLMDTVQILCTLKNIKSFLGVYPSDLLPHWIRHQTDTVIINVDPHTKMAHTGLQSISNPSPPRHIILIPMGNHHTIPIYKHF